MDKKFTELQKKWLQATSETKRYEIEQEFAKLAETDPETFASDYKKSIQETVERAKLLSVKEQIKSITDIISISYISKTYFGRSKDWLYQRINGYNVNGKQATLKKSEIETLNNALTDIAKKISSVKISV